MIPQPLSMEAMTVCVPGVRRKIMEKSPEQLHKMVINRRHFPFLVPAKCSFGRAVLLAGVCPCLARTDTHLALQSPEEVTRSRWLSGAV